MFLLIKSLESDLVCTSLGSSGKVLQALNQILPVSTYVLGDYIEATLP